MYESFNIIEIHVRRNILLCEIMYFHKGIVYFVKISAR